MTVTARFFGNYRNEVTRYYWVQAIFPDGRGAITGPASLTRPLVLDNNDFVLIAWDAQSGAIGYDVIITTTSSSPTGTLSTGGVALNTSKTSTVDNGIYISWTESPAAPVGTVTSISGPDYLSWANPTSTPTATSTLFAPNAKTGTYQILAADFASHKTITVASGTFTITLVASGSQPVAGQSIHVINYGSGVVTVARSGQNINGGTSSLTLAAGSATAPTEVWIVSDGTNYFAAVSAAGGGTPGGADTQVQFNNAGSFGGSANLTFAGDATPKLNIGAATDPSGLAFGSRLNSVMYSTDTTAAYNAVFETNINDPTPGVSAMAPYNFYTELNGAFAYKSLHGLSVFADLNTAGASITDSIDAGNFNVNLNDSQTTVIARGIYPSVQIYGGTCDTCSAVWFWNGFYGGVTTLGVNAYMQKPDLGGTVTTFAHLWAEDLGGLAGITNPYYTWYDSRGVFRIKEDNTFDSVGQAIAALYNPQVTKYVPGASNYERIVLAQWNGNVAEIGTEKGGTGTLRPVRLLGPSVEAVAFTNVPIAVASLPAAAAGNIGQRRFVNDANTTTALGVGTTVANGGANIVPVYSDGVSWKIG